MLLLISVFVVVPLILLVATFLLVVFLYNAAKNKRQATFVAEGTMEFVMAGEDLKRVLLNADGYILTENDYIKPVSDKYTVPGQDKATEEEKKKYRKRRNFITRYLQNSWGFYWVSFFYPLKKIHRFQITKSRLKPANKTADDAPLRERIEMDSELATINNLRVRFPRPFLFERVETSDRIETDMVVMAMLQVERPHTVVFLVGKEFFTTLEAAISGAVIDYMKKRSYVKFVEDPTGKGSEFSEFIRKLNSEPSVKYPNGIVQDLGVRIIDVWVEDYGLPADALAAKKATQALEIQRLEGEADVKRSEFDMTAAQNRAKGSAATVIELAAAYRSVDPHVVAAIRDQNVSSNLTGKESKLTVLSMGNSGPQLALHTDPMRSTPSGQTRTTPAESETPPGST